MIEELKSLRAFSSSEALTYLQAMNLPSIGGGDCYQKAQVGRAFTEFKNSVSTIDSLVEEIKKGNCSDPEGESSQFFS